MILLQASWKWDSLPASVKLPSFRVPSRLTCRSPEKSLMDRLNSPPPHPPTPGRAGWGMGKRAPCSLATMRWGRILEGDPAHVSWVGASPTSKTTSRARPRTSSTTFPRWWLGLLGGRSRGCSRGLWSQPPPPASGRPLKMFLRNAENPFGSEETSFFQLFFLLVQAVGLLQNLTVEKKADLEWNGG